MPSVPPVPVAALAMLATLAALVMAGAGCGELRGRRRIQQGNAAYKHGDFLAAVARFKEAEMFVPEMPLLWLNKGYACRELIVPGARTEQSRLGAECALGAFKRFRELAPDDPRGDRLYVQTLFDIGEHRTIERIFRLRHEKNPDDLDVVLALEQVYVKMGRWREALVFYRRAAALRPHDAEAHYAAGTYLWQVLQAHGGGPAEAAYDPRPVPAPPPPAGTRAGASERTAERRAPPPAPAVAPPPPPPPPAPAPGAVVGAERLALADEGIRYLERALALRPRYPEAMMYMGLLQRQRSFALWADPAAWQRAVDLAAAQGQAAAVAAQPPRAGAAGDGKGAH
jgi:tetratricopeptide (TPR) repeat protein